MNGANEQSQKVNGVSLPDRFAIAIDGPVAAGKSTVAGLVAERLDAVVFDTGILYRAVTLAAVQDGIDAGDEEALEAVAADLDVKILPPSVDDGRLADVIFRGRDVTWKLRSPEVDRILSPIAALPGVRRALLEPQRRIGKSGRVVIVGRDIGTVVMPDADLKVFLEASPAERARRRHEEMVGKIPGLTYDEVLEALRRRDRIDSGRELAPLAAAEDAFVISTDDLPATAVADRIVERFLAICGETSRHPGAEPEK